MIVCKTRTAVWNTCLETEHIFWLDILWHLYMTSFSEMIDDNMTLVVRKWWVCDTCYENVTPVMRMWHQWWECDTRDENVTPVMRMWHLLWECDNSDENVTSVMSMWHQWCECDVTPVMGMWHQWCECDTNKENVTRFSYLLSTCLSSFQNTISVSLFT